MIKTKQKVPTPVYVRLALPGLPLTTSPAVGPPSALDTVSRSARSSVPSTALPLQAKHNLPTQALVMGSGVVDRPLKAVSAPLDFALYSLIPYASWTFRFVSRQSSYHFQYTKFFSS
jgi:hypothetical protein